MKSAEIYFVKAFARIVASLIRLSGKRDHISDELFKTKVGSIEAAKESGVNKSDMELLEFYYKSK